MIPTNTIYILIRNKNPHHNFSHTNTLSQAEYHNHFGPSLCYSKCYQKFKYASRYRTFSICIYCNKNVSQLRKMMEDGIVVSPTFMKTKIKMISKWPIFFISFLVVVALRFCFFPLHIFMRLFTSLYIISELWFCEVKHTVFIRAFGQTNIIGDMVLRWYQPILQHIFFYYYLFSRIKCALIRCWRRRHKNPWKIFIHNTNGVVGLALAYGVQRDGREAGYISQPGQVWLWGDSSCPRFWVQATTKKYGMYSGRKIYATTVYENNSISLGRLGQLAVSFYDALNKLFWTVFSLLPMIGILENWTNNIIIFSYWLNC